MRSLDFSSWQALLSTFFGLATITLLGVGIRLLLMQTVQQRREKQNRQINERLKTLIAAYKVLGGSFTGDLHVAPTHLRELKEKKLDQGSDRGRRIRDAVEAALSDIILLGTEEQVRLAAHAATELAAGRTVHTADLVLSLRIFIRDVLQLDPIPVTVVIPKQGPTRPGPSKGGGKGEGGGGEGGKGGGGNAGGGGMGGGGEGGAPHQTNEEDDEPHHS